MDSWCWSGKFDVDEIPSFTEGDVFQSKRGRLINWFLYVVLKRCHVQI